METIAVAEKLYTVEEYIEMEFMSNFKHEFHDGEITQMPGGTIQHGEIGLNVASTLRLGLKGTLCKAYSNDQAIAINDFNYVYPDASVVCGERKRGILHQHSIANPTLIVEVLSTSSANYDKGDKFDQYQTIPSFAEYVLVRQDRVQVSVYTRLENNHWDLRIYDNIEGVISLKSINYDLKIADIYEEVVFDKAL